MGNELQKPVTSLTEQSSLDARVNYAQTLAASNLLPDAYKKNPANVLVAIEYGNALGIAPIQALNSINIIKGKPTMSADLMATMVRKAGHRLRVTGDDKRAEVTIIRKDDPDYVPAPIVWTLERAQQAGLLSNPSWKKYPAAMLRARAITEAARAWASDALAGVIYTEEELANLPSPSSPSFSKASGDWERQLATAARNAIGRGLSKQQALDLTVSLTQGRAHSFNEITVQDAPALIEAFNNWQPTPEEDGLDVATGEIIEEPPQEAQHDDA